MHHYLLAALLVFLPSLACGAENVVIVQDSGHESEKKYLSGRVITEARDGGILLQTRDGFLWAIQPGELLERTSDQEPFLPFSADELSAELRKELPAPFEIHETAHYLVCHNTSKAYAKWCGALYERLYRAFHNYWGRRGLPLHDPEFPLVAVVFRDKASFEQYSQKELGDVVNSIIGYYSLTTNRVTMYDLTGVEAFRARSGRILTVQEINRALATPKMERTVATVIHEATHQIAFNCGLHGRFADIPLWLSEGVAMYFETPDLKSSRGWRNIGGVNHVRLGEFHNGLAGRGDDSLQTLLADDQRFRMVGQMADAYPESWALVYFLIRQKPDRFVEYLKVMAQKKPLIDDTPETRLAEFRAAFGHDLKKLDAKFVRQLMKVR